jgi:hypothetical protein
VRMGPALIRAARVPPSTPPLFRTIDRHFFWGQFGGFSVSGIHLCPHTSRRDNSLRRYACKARSSTNPDLPQDAEVVAHRPVPIGVPASVRFKGQTESVQAPRSLSRPCPGDAPHHRFGIPAALSPQECPWFPGAQIGAESELKRRDNRVFLLGPGGSAVEGIVFVGEIVPD